MNAADNVILRKPDFAAFDAASPMQRAFHQKGHFADDGATAMSADAPAPQSSRCPRCDARFHCGAQADRCWCQTLPPLAPLAAAADGTTLAQCLCRHCLQDALAQAPRRPAGPQG